YFGTRIDRAKNVATRAMKKTRDRAESFALGPLAAAGRAEEHEGVVFHGRKSFIPQIHYITQALSSRAFRLRSGQAPSRNPLMLSLSLAARSFAFSAL